MQVNRKIVLSSLVLGMLMIGCGSSSPVLAIDNEDNQTSMGQTDDQQTNNQTRFAAMTMNNQIVMQDTTTNLEWANGAGGCHPMAPGITAMDAFNETVEHCEMMDFSTHTDWRVPTIEEIQTFTVQMQNAGLIPFYQNPACPRVVGYNEDNTTIQNTNTHNTPPIGTITDWTEQNAGVRCVRDLPVGM
jgi:hypothetical protein